MNIDVVAEAMCNAATGRYGDLTWDALIKEWGADCYRCNWYRKMAKAAIESIFGEVTRVDLIKRAGTTSSLRSEHWADSWEPSLQDEGRTLKLFAGGSGYEAECSRDESLAKDLTV